MNYKKLAKKLKANGHDPALFIQLSRNNQKRILRTFNRKPNTPKWKEINEPHKKRMYGPNLNHPYYGPKYKRQADKSLWSRSELGLPTRKEIVDAAEKVIEAARKEIDK